MIKEIGYRERLFINGKGDCYCLLGLSLDYSPQDNQAICKAHCCQNVFGVNYFFTDSVGMIIPSVVDLITKQVGYSFR